MNGTGKSARSEAGCFFTAATVTALFYIVGLVITSKGGTSPRMVVFALLAVLAGPVLLLILGLAHQARRAWARPASIALPFVQLLIALEILRGGALSSLPPLEQAFRFFAAGQLLCFPASAVLAWTVARRRRESSRSVRG